MEWPDSTTSYYYSCKFFIQEAGDAHSPLDGLSDGRLALQDGPPGVEEEVPGRRRQVSGLHRHADAAQEALPLHRLRPRGREGRTEAGRQ